MIFNHKNYKLLQLAAGKISCYLAGDNFRSKHLGPLAKTYIKLNKLNVENEMISIGNDDMYIVLLFAKANIDNNKVGYMRLYNTYFVTMQPPKYYENLSNEELIDELENILESIIDTDDESPIDAYYKEYIKYLLLNDILYTTYTGQIIDVFKESLPQYIDYDSLEPIEADLFDEQNFKQYSPISECGKYYQIFLRGR